MTPHLSEETLWDAAKTAPIGDDYAHLQLCQDCRSQLESIRFAQSMLVEPPPPPALSEDSARRIGNTLRKAAEKQARSSLWYAPFWPFNFSPTWALAPVAAALLAFFAYRLTQPPSADAPSLAQKAPVTVPDGPTPPPMPEAPRPAPAKKVVASVKRTKAAQSGGNALARSQQLSEGSTVATAKGGEVLMALPDGSQIGVMSSSQVQLAKLEDKAVTLDIERGSMKVTARHDTSRELKVRAGDLEVVDVGTEFIVSRDEGRTVVAVEEGEVEVKANGESVPLRAGQAVEWRGGQLKRQQWATADELPKRAAAPRQLPQPVAKKPSVEETPDIPSEPQKTTPPPEAVETAPAPPAPTPEPEVAQAPASNPDEWALPSTAGEPAPVPPPVPPPEPPAEPSAAAQGRTEAPLPPATDDEADVSFLSRVQQHLNKIRGVFKPPSRLQRANDIAVLTERRYCTDAIHLADVWLGESVPRGESFSLRRSVLQSKMRCLLYLGRTGEAQAVERDLEKL